MFRKQENMWCNGRIWPKCGLYFNIVSPAVHTLLSSVLQRLDSCHGIEALILEEVLRWRYELIIGGDPGGDGGDVSPPRIFLGGIVPPSIFESLKNIYSCIAF